MIPVLAHHSPSASHATLAIVLRIMALIALLFVEIMLYNQARTAMMEIVSQVMDVHLLVQLSRVSAATNNM